MGKNSESKILKDRLPLISICVPVLNEEGNIDELYHRLDQLSVRMQKKCDLEFIFTDNHSSDGTWNKLTALAKKDARVRALRFSKNFGFQRSILANYGHVRGDALLQIDADLQDPPELLEEFFDLWQQGYHVVYGIRKKRPESWFLNKFRKIGYWGIDLLSEHPIPRDAGDFRLIDRKVVEALKKYRSANPYLRGMIASMGFQQKGVPYARFSRTSGKSKFNIRQLTQLGLSGVFNHSVVPLRLATIAGIIMLALAICGAFYYFIVKILNPDLPVGIASILILILFGIGFQALLLGILGEYLLRIYKILRREPIAIVEQSLNFSPEEINL